MRKITRVIKLEERISPNSSQQEVIFLGRVELYRIYEMRMLNHIIKREHQLLNHETVQQNQQFYYAVLTLY